MTFQHPVQRGIDAFCIVTEVAQVTADKGKLCLSGINVLDPAYLFNGFGLKDITPQSVYCISRINNDPAIFKAFCHLADEPWLGILWMNL